MEGLAIDVVGLPAQKSSFVFSCGGTALEKMSNQKIFLLLSILFLLALLAQLPYLSLPFTENEGIYGAVAQEMRFGASLYKDVWDHKPPLIYLEYEFIQNFFGRSEFALHLAVVFCHWICTILVWILTRRLGFRAREAWASALTYCLLVAPPWFQAWTGQADLTMQPWILCSFILILCPWRAACFLSGCCWALAFFTKQTALIYLPIFLLFSGKPWLELVVEFLVGADLVAAVVAGPFYFSGRMQDFWDAIWGYNLVYVGKSWRFFSNTEGYYGAVLTWAVTVLLGLGVAWAAVLVAIKRSVDEFRKHAPSHRFGFVAVWFCLALISCCLSGRFTSYYFVVLLAPMALALGALTFEAKEHLGKVFPILAGLILIPVIYSQSRAWHRGSALVESGWYPAERLRAARDIGVMISNLAKPEDELLAWTTEPEIYVYSGLPMATVSTPLVNHLEEMPVKLDDAKILFAAKPPQFVVLSSFSQVLPCPDWLKAGLRDKYLYKESVFPYDLYVKK
jgi:4-amino-4-deoxy-L-arabinose transferase-like glycosyltransferase